MSKKAGKMLIPKKINNDWGLYNPITEKWVSFSGRIYNPIGGKNACEIIAKQQDDTGFEMVTVN